MATKKTKSKKNSRYVGGVKIRGERKSKNREELEGILSLSASGFGFVKVDGLEDDIYIPYRKVGKALSGDKVKITIARKKTRNASKKDEGEVIRVLERSGRPHIGILSIRGNRVWAIVESRTMPYDVRINVASPEDLPEFDGVKPTNGMKVAVLVTDWPARSPEPLGKVVDLLGEPGNNETEMHAILAAFQLPYRFEAEVERAAQAIPDTISAEEMEGRRDFRQTTTFTIDPADAKDFDDALSFKSLGDGLYEIGVHIADVSHYVTPGSIIDKEAFNRATSVYLVDRTIPMLPEQLSNKLCSLRPGEDKLCYSAVFKMDDKAAVKDFWFGHTIIKSDYRFDYETAQKIIETKEGPLSEEILKLHEMASILRKKRFDDGAISFERPEMKVIVDKDGKPLDVCQKISKESNFLIEEFMLLANRSVAEYAAKKCRIKDPTFVYRIHENPNPEKLDSLRSFAKNFGRMLGDTSDARQAAKSLNELMKAAKDSPEQNALQLLALRSMARARYSTDNVGHYGLAFKYYCHFTSPIRRYPDIMVHRLLDIYAAGGKNQDRLTYEQYCEHTSQREQIATEAERESIKYKLVEFMQDKIGQEFEGEISGLTEWGIYVEIIPTRVEGMVSLREVTADYLEFDEDKYETRGKATKRVFRLGDKVKIRVLRANLEQKILDYELVWDY